MKKIISLLFAAFCATSLVFAQSSQLATLSHGSTITTYYGATAFKQAHTDAADGDVITLSSGSFNGFTITKAVTVRGAGMGMDTVNNTNPTIINSNFTVNVPANDSYRLTLEGIYHDGNITFKNATNVLVLKCRLYTVTVNSTTTTDVCIKDGNFLHCKIFNLNFVKGNASFLNSIISYVTAASNLTISNSIVFESDQITRSSFYNCILATYSKALPSSNIAYNCIGQNRDDSSENIFADLSNNKSNKRVTLSTVFGTNVLNLNDDEYVDIDNRWYHLSDAGAQYVGNDGKEVGIYGGNMPFDPRTTVPQITRCNVAAKSTADGKLSVDIEVSTAE